jgi:hypothetical protein
MHHPHAVTGYHTGVADFSGHKRPPNSPKPQRSTTEATRLYPQVGLYFCEPKWTPAINENTSEGRGFESLRAGSKFL